MRKLGQLMISAIVAIMIIPAAITMTLGNNQQLSGYAPMSKSEEQSQETERLSLEKLVGIVAKEIPINYEAEVLKAQVIMARSYIASNNKQELSYMSEEEMKSLWESDYNKNYLTIKEAVDDTRNMILTYNNEPIQPVYHRQNTGVTQNPVEIWDLDVPYLESVESSWDEAGKDLLQEKQYDSQEIIKRINENFDTTVLEPYSLETQIQIIERTQGGYVKSMQVGNKLMSGDDFRKLLDLRSSCFVMQYNNNQVKIVTKGTGHGVGLSQYGANQMALEGKKVEEILKHYFPKAEIEEQK